MRISDFRLRTSLIKSHTFDIPIEELNFEYISFFATKWKENRIAATIRAHNHSSTQTKNGGWLGFLGSAFPFVIKTMLFANKET